MNDGTKILAITNENKNSEPQRAYATEVDGRLSTLKENYYKWLARLLILFASVSLIVFMAASLVLFRMAPRVEVEPFLIVKQDATDGLVRHEPIEYNMASKKQLMEIFVKQYVIIRNSLINDEREMQIRWFAGGWVHFLSMQNVFDEFDKQRKAEWQSVRDSGASREVEIISVGKQGGENSPVWKIDFKTYELNPQARDLRTGEIPLKTKYWTASMTAYFIRGRELMSVRLFNPLGFTVVRYSQTEVEVL